MRWDNGRYKKVKTDAVLNYQAKLMMGTRELFLQIILLGSSCRTWSFHLRTIKTPAAIFGERISLVVLMFKMNEMSILFLLWDSTKPTELRVSTTFQLKVSDVYSRSEASSHLSAFCAGANLLSEFTSDWLSARLRCVWIQFPKSFVETHWSLFVPDTGVMLTPTPPPPKYALCPPTVFIRIAAFLGAAAVTLGAYGAHGECLESIPTVDPAGTGMCA